MNPDATAVFSHDAVDRILGAIKAADPTMRARILQHPRSSLHRELEEAASAYLLGLSGKPRMKAKKSIAEALGVANSLSAILCETHADELPNLRPLMVSLLKTSNPNLTDADLQRWETTLGELTAVLSTASTTFKVEREVTAAFLESYDPPKGRPINTPIAWLINRLGICWFNLSGSHPARSTGGPESKNAGEPSGPAFRFFSQVFAELRDAFAPLPEAEELCRPLRLRDKALDKQMERHGSFLTIHGQKSGK